MKLLSKLTITASLLLIAGVSHADDKKLYVYNWSDYIAEDTLANFEKETGIKVTYDVFDSNDVLEAKLLSGNTGYDVVVPTGTFLARQIQAGVFQPLDMSKLPNHKNLDAGMMKKLAALDPNNAHAVPYMWGTTGIGINVNKVKERLGDDVDLSSWDIIFKPENAEKLADCGITMLDAYDEIVPTVLNYVGVDPKSESLDDLRDKAMPVLTSIRPYIRYFHSSQYINDLANGDVCVSIGWSGDIMQAMSRAEEAENGVEIAYIIPNEGAGLWFDMLAVPKDANNVDEAHQFINYLMRPDVMADITNYVWYPNAIPSSKAEIDEEIVNDPSIYPTEEVYNKLFTFPVNTPKYDRQATREWTKLKTAM